MADPVVLEILGRAIDTHGVERLALWLTVPRGRDQRTPADHLAAGNYDRARLLAVTNPPWKPIAARRGEVT